MKDTIKQIIESNLPEKKKENYLSPDIRIDEQNGFNQALSQINTSLIADEVLKVEKEVIKVKIKPIVYGSDNFLENVGYNQAILDILQLLSNLSPTKENKNNE